MQNRSGRHLTSSFFLVPMLVALSGCSDQGDLGRHSPSLVSQTYTSSLNRAKVFFGEEEDYDLPLTAAEDALRTRAKDMQAISYSGLISRVIPARNGDGYLRVAAMIEDLKVERQRFASFAEAAQKVMQIDDVRRDRLAGLDALTARRQFSIAVERRGLNDRLIRNGVRTMRERSLEYKKRLLRLPVELPDVPLEELEAVHDDFHEDIVRFHAQIDQRAHGQLAGKSRRSSLK